MIKPPIHPATPRRLKTKFKRARWNFQTLAKALGVNVYYVHRLIRYGEEPTNANIRKMLFLPRPAREHAGGHPHSGRHKSDLSAVPAQAEPLPPHIKWWRYTLDKKNRNRIVERLYHDAGTP
jgi:hypothetical protein